MNNREKLMIGVVAVVAVLFVGQLFYKSYASKQTKLKADVAKAKKDLQEADLKLKIAKSNDVKLKIWQEQSLPHGNQTRAYQLYYNWLYDTLEKSRLKPDKADRLTTPALASQVGTIGIAVQTKGSLTDLVEFLYKFYSSPQLHQITRMELTPETGGNSLKTIKIQVEALMVPGAGNNTVPPEGTLNPFKLADVSDYRVAIDRRNIFAAYKRPSATPVASERAIDPSLDDSRFAKFTGTTLGPKGLMAWIHRMNTGDQLLVTEGDPVNVGTWKGKVVTVENRALTVEKDGKRTKIDIGGLINSGKPVATPPPPKPQGDEGEKKSEKSNATPAESAAAAETGSPL